MEPVYEELILPASLDADGGAAFAEMVEMTNAVTADVVGRDDLAYEPAGELAQLDGERNAIRILLARVAGRIVGRALVLAPLEAGSETADVEVDVLPQVRNAGIGSALLAWGEEVAAALGRTALHCWPFSRPALAGEEVIVPPTGAGAIPAADAGARFLTARGWRLAQVYRISRIDLHAAREATAAAGARAREASTGYELLTWAGSTPPPYRNDLAALYGRMLIDAPMSDLAIDEEEWDAERLEAYERRAADGGVVLVTAVARHRESGRIVAFSSASLPLDRRRPAEQGDTLVHGEHRGHRLGMLVKVGLHDEIARVSPGTQAVITYNAEEN
ncbi:MAG TPA: GNAT family N-acetyltransferase, partial [Naasia sp.]